MSFRVHHYSRKTSMTIDIEISLCETHLLATATGAFAYEPVMDAVRQILEAAWEQRQPRIVMDWRGLSGMDSLTTTETFEGVRAFAGQVSELRSRGLTGLRVAHIVNVYLPDTQGFGETVAANRGVETKIATTPEDA